MQDLTESSVTGAVVGQMEQTEDARLREVMESLVRHLHGFAREVRLTPEEWLRAVGFLTEVGQTCTPARQEFILLSDVLGLSALVNLMHDATATELGTESSLLGPFYRQDAPEFALGESIAVDAEGPALEFRGRVVDRAGAGVGGASVQVWQTDAEGSYDLQKDGGARMDMRGNFRADGEGRFHFRTVVPLGYHIPMDGPVGRLVRAQGRHGCRPAHIHVLIGAPGYREMVTALYLGSDPNIDSDVVFGVSNALVVEPRVEAEGSQAGVPAVRYEFRLSAETAGGSNRVGADPAQLMGARLTPARAAE